MNIILDNIIFELQRAGGISKVWSKQIEQFLKQKIKFKAIENQAASDNIFRKSLAVPANLIRQDTNYPLTLRRYMKARAPHADIFHSSYYRTPATDVPSVVTIHDFMYEKFDKGLRQRLHRLQKENAMNHATSIVCVSEHTRNDLLKLHPHMKTKNIFVIHNGVDEEFHVLKNKEETLSIQGVSLTYDDYILHVGSRGYCKNFPLEISIFASAKNEYKNLKFVIVGGSSISDYETSLFLKNQLSLDDVIHIPSTDNVELNILYNHAKALTFPSRYEGFGIPALEAIKCGCPVIAANTSSIPEVVGKEYPLLFNPESSKSMSNTVALLSNSSAVNDAIESGIIHARKFSWENTTTKLLDAYNNTLSN